MGTTKRRSIGSSTTCSDALLRGAQPAAESIDRSSGQAFAVRSQARRRQSVVSREWKPSLNLEPLSRAFPVVRGARADRAPSGSRSRSA